MVRATKLLLIALFFSVVLFRPWLSQGAEFLDWKTEGNVVSAEIQTWDLNRLLERIAAATGWQVFVEPGTKQGVSTKFKQLPPGEALRLLLGDLSYVVLKGTNNTSKLLVFRTSPQGATQLVKAPKGGTDDPTAKPIPNELIVTLKPGEKIDDLAKRLGAKVTGKIDKSNAYRLQFDDEDAAKSAREELEKSPEVASVDNNYSIRRPESPDALAFSSMGPPSLQLKPPPAGDRVIIGLLDTAIQKQGGALDQFLLPGISVAGDAALPSDYPAHGTSMYQTILRGLSMLGSESSAAVLPVDIYGRNAETTMFHVAAGVVEAINAGATIINMSLGSAGDSPFLHNIIKQSSGKVAFFAAAGNEPTTDLSFPAAYPEVFAVTAGARDGSIAPYANRGSFVDLIGPPSTVVTLNGEPWMVMGTSASTAFMSGMGAALMDSKKVGLNQLGSALQSLTPGKK